MNRVSLPEDLLARLTTEFVTADTVGLVLTGSHARGDATCFSDVDLGRFVTTLPEAEEERYTLLRREGWLISLFTTTVAARRAELARPESAIWAVPGMRQARILFDRDGSLAALRAEAEAFRWEPLQEAADAYASYQLMGLAEEAHKVMAGLRGGDETLALYGTYGLVLGLAQAVAVQRGALIHTENVFFRQVQEAVGTASPWAAAFRRAVGLEPAPADGAPALWRAAAALQLYRETAALFAPILQPRHRPVVEATVNMLRAF
ncbi:MAG: nucleotidyltransferase domain-containing protein [Anaerolineae bacterium]|nr:nucleotidyltransferase domain-containing protein [Anaerolineae bacterium]